MHMQQKNYVKRLKKRKCSYRKKNDPMNLKAAVLMNLHQSKQTGGVGITILLILKH